MGEPLDLLALYTAELDKTLLTAEEERALFAALPDKAARERLITANLRLVLGLARRYVDRGVDLPDLIEIGNLALIEAVDHFDVSRGARLTTYATKCIRGRILRAIQEAPIVPLPVHIAEQQAQMRRTEDALTQQLGRTPTSAELAVALKMAEADLACVRRCQQKALPLFEDDDPVEVEADDTVAEDALQLALAADATKRMATLPAKEQWVLRQRYGLDGIPRTLREVGQVLQMTAAGVQVVEKRALAALKEAMEMDDLLYQDPMTGQVIGDDPYDDYSPPAPAASVVTPAKGQCDTCRHGGKGQKYCRHSGYTIGTNAALKWCAPVAAT